ncbi:hypothetical protein CEXT_322581 [Caerostris extrusa]|uniref:Uncharacterized protein n=1 Tax=Caerostris extrusa TaxID=172846 RepID=A0AAV4W1U6_CAEEX|nr:hypothetical protein CEXT_322581 [Caerostris extrusa]
MRVLKHFGTEGQLSLGTSVQNYGAISEVIYKHHTDGSSQFIDPIPKPGAFDLAKEIFFRPFCLSRDLISMRQTLLEDREIANKLEWKRLD